METKKKKKKKKTFTSSYIKNPCTKFQHINTLLSKLQDMANERTSKNKDTKKQTETKTKQNELKKKQKKKQKKNNLLAIKNTAPKFKHICTHLNSFSLTSKYGSGIFNFEIV